VSKLSEAIKFVISFVLYNSRQFQDKSRQHSRTARCLYTTCNYFLLFFTSLLLQGLEREVGIGLKLTAQLQQYMLYQNMDPTPGYHICNRKKTPLFHSLLKSKFTFDAWCVICNTQTAPKCICGSSAPVYLWEWFRIILGIKNCRRMYFIFISLVLYTL